METKIRSLIMVTIFVIWTLACIFNFLKNGQLPDPPYYTIPPGAYALMYGLSRKKDEDPETKKPQPVEEAK